VNLPAADGARARAGWLLGLALMLASTQVCADAGWFESGDSQLRLDLQLLNDAEIIRYPLNQWPIPRAGLQYALANAKDHFATNSAVVAALERVRARLVTTNTRRVSFETGIRAGEPGLWRDFDTLAREDGELYVAHVLPLTSAQRRRASIAYAAVAVGLQAVYDGRLPAPIVRLNIGLILMVAFGLSMALATAVLQRGARPSAMRATQPAPVIPSLAPADDALITRIRDYEATSGTLTIHVRSDWKR